MEFKKYPKIPSLTNCDGNFRGETEGILNGTCFIQEKIDGANLSVWTKDGEIRVGSRNQDVSLDSFRGAVEYINTHKGIKALLDTLEGEIRLYGEWLVPHTITNYNPEAYNHFYLFDIEVNGEPLSPVEVDVLSEKFGIKSPKVFILENPTVEEISKYVGQSNIGPTGEGIVIKNDGFINKWGNEQYAKIVGEKFKEENFVVFGNHQKGDNEMKIANKYCVPGRVRKIMNKIEQNEDRDIVKKDIKQIIGRLQNDIITEEAWNISKEGTINFKRLKGIIGRRGARISVDIIEGNEESVAFSE